MVKKLHIKENNSDINLQQYVGKDFYTFYIVKEDSFNLIEYGDTAGGDEGEAIIEMQGRKFRVVYEWLWNDTSDLFEKKYKSGKILYIDEL